MDPDPNELPEPESTSPWWRRPIVLGGLVLLLALSSLITLRSPSRGNQNEASRLSLEVSMGAREAYAMHRNPVLRLDEQARRRRQEELLSKFRRLVRIDRSAGGIRRLALVEHALGTQAWRETLGTLRMIPVPRLFDTESELAMWGEVLGSSPVNPARAPAIEQQLERMDLGWYRNLALESLYTNVGWRDRAEQASRAARRPWNRMLTLGIAAFLVILAGLGLGLLMAIYLTWARKNPGAPRPPLLALYPPPPLGKRQGETLYFVFLVYLISYAVMQMGVGRLLGSALNNRLTSSPDYVLPLISVLTVILWLTIPLYALKLLALRVGLTSRDIGLRSDHLVGDILWGIGGWMVALPMVIGVTVVASIVFRGVDTPTHPAVLELAGSRNALTILLLMLQASVIAPLSEELMFRGVFFRSLTPRLQWIPAMVVASSVFAILHPQLPLGFFGLFTLGAMFNTLYALRGSLVPAIAAHALNNTAVLVGVLLIFGN